MKRLQGLAEKQSPSCECIMVAQSLLTFASIMLTPHEILYGGRCILTLCGGVLVLRYLVGPDWVRETSRKVKQK